MVSSKLDMVASLHQRMVCLLLSLFCFGDFLACTDDTWVVIDTPGFISKPMTEYPGARSMSPHAVAPTLTLGFGRTSADATIDRKNPLFVRRGRAGSGVMTSSTVVGATIAGENTLSLRRVAGSGVMFMRSDVVGIAASGSA